MKDEIRKRQRFDSSFILHPSSLILDPFLRVQYAGTVPGGHAGAQTGAHGGGAQAGTGVAQHGARLLVVEWHPMVPNRIVKDRAIVVSSFVMGNTSNRGLATETCSPGPKGEQEYTRSVAGTFPRPGPLPASARRFASHAFSLSFTKVGRSAPPEQRVDTEKVRLFRGVVGIRATVPIGPFRTGLPRMPEAPILRDGMLHRGRAAGFIAAQQLRTARPSLFGAVKSAARQRRYRLDKPQDATYG
jgi:hypothetical protein